MITYLGARGIEGVWIYNCGLLPQNDEKFATPNDVSSQEDRAQIPAPFDLTLKKIKCIMEAAAGAGESLTVTVNKATVATAMQVVLSGATEIIDSDSTEVSFSEDDLLSISLLPSATSGNLYPSITLHWQKD